MKKLVYSGIIGHVTCRESDLALAVTSDGNINQLGDGDNGNLGVQDDAKIYFYFESLLKDYLYDLRL